MNLGRHDALIFLNSYCLGGCGEDCAGDWALLTVPDWVGLPAACSFSACFFVMVVRVVVRKPCIVPRGMLFTKGATTHSSATGTVRVSAMVSTCKYTPPSFCSMCQ